jgi:hypothetical protein
VVANGGWECDGIPAMGCECNDEGNGGKKMGIEMEEVRDAYDDLLLLYTL